MQGTTVFGSHDRKYYIASDWLDQGTNQNYVIQRGPTVFWNRYTGGPLCLDPMIQDIILRQIGLAQEQITKTMPYGEPTIFWKRNAGEPLCLDLMLQHIILPQIGLAQDK